MLLRRAAINLSASRPVEKLGQGLAPVRSLPTHHHAAKHSVAAAAGPPNASSGRPAATPAAPEVYTESPDPEIVAFQQHQKSAARVSPAEAARTMTALARFGLLATISVREEGGFPLGSVVEYTVDPSGRPVFAVSSLSAHTTDMAEDGRISLTVMESGFKGVQDGRFTLQGRVRPVSDAERPALRDAFIKKYPDAFWVDFADFRWFIMDQIVAGRYNGGFAMAKRLSGEDYLGAAADPVAAFSGPVCGHMNDDHQADTIAMIKHYVGLSVDSARLTDLDRLGMNAVVTRKGQSFKLRLPFAKPVTDRKGIKDAIVEMTKAARGAPAAPQQQQ